MKRSIFRFAMIHLPLLLLFFAATTMANGQISGNYTIDGSQAASATNYQDFQSVVDDLSGNARTDAGPSNNTGSGVTGATVFSIANGTYTESISLPAITGVSSTNTILFDGGSGNAANVILQGVSSQLYTVEMNGADYVTFRNVTFSMSTNASATTSNILLSGGSDYFSVDSCVFNSNTTTTKYHIYSTASPNHFVSITSSTFNANGYGISLSPTSAANQPYVYNNTISSIANDGIYLGRSDSALVLNNTITGATGGTFEGINISMAGNGPVIANNKVSGFGNGSGIYISQILGSASKHALIYNNVVVKNSGAFTDPSVQLNNASYFDVYHNTFICRGTGLGNNTVFLASVSDFTMQNNILHNTGGGNAYSEGASVTHNNGDLDYNNYYTTGSNIADWNGTPYSNLAAWQTGVSTQNGSSVSINTPFINIATNQQLSSFCSLTGTNLGLTTDFAGTTRNNPPTLGAYEYTTTNNLQVVAIRQPFGTYSMGNTNVVVTIKNLGTNAVTSANISYQYDANTAVTTTLPGTLNPCDTVQITFTGGQQLNLTAGSHTLRAWTDSPNGSTDADATNDTISSGSFCTQMSGTFTIDASGSGATNFTTFAAAVNALTCGGVNGAVNFAVASGTYNESISLGAITGTSASNTVTFRSYTANAADVVLAGVNAQVYTVRMNGADYIRFEAMSFNISSNATVTTANVQFTGGSDFNLFDSCIFNGTGSTTRYHVYDASATANHQNTFTNNTFNANGWGVVLSPSTATRQPMIVSNTFNSIANVAVYVANSDSTIINRNVITSSGTANFNGIQLLSCNNGPVISNNMISGFNTGNGISITTSNGTVSKRGAIFNNVIYNNAAAITSGFMITATSSNSYLDFYHNTLLNRSTSGATTSWGAFQINSSNNFNIKNNILHCTGTGYAYVETSSNTHTSGDLDFNNYWNASGNIAWWQSGPSNGNQATLTSWRTNITTQNVNSLNQNTPFTTIPTNLNLTQVCAFAGTNAGITTDYVGTTRRTGTPSMGAYENLGVNNDLQVVAIRTPSTYSVGLTNVVVTVRNNGTNAISSGNVGYTFDGGSAVSTTLPSSLNPCDTIQITFSGGQQLNITAGYHMLKAFTDGPNGNTDALLTNDTATALFCAGSIAGTFTIDSTLNNSNTNFRSFNRAINALRTCGLSGAVTLNVNPGTYTEQVDISGISGLSTTNRLTIQGQSANVATTILQATSVSGAPYTLRINNLSNITVQNLTIRANGTSFASWPVHLLGNTGCSNDTIRKCIIDFGSTPVANFTSTNYQGVVLNGNATSYNTTGIHSNNAIDSNTINGGYNSINFYGNSTVGNTGNQATGNTINNSSQYGIYVQGMNGCVIDRNNITLSSNTTTSAGIYLNSNFTATSGVTWSVQRNKMTNMGQFGIYVSTTQPFASTRGNIINNMIGGGFRNTNPYGIYAQSSSYNWNAFHNTINLDNAATSTSSACIYIGNCCTTGSTLWDVRNNIFVVSNSSSTSLMFYWPNDYQYSVTGTAGFTNNVFFKNGATASSNVAYNAGTYITRAQIIGHASYNSGSVYANPMFYSNTDLRVADPGNNFTQISGITSDYFGTSRGASTDAGAHENAGLTNDLGVTALVSPSAPLSSGSQNIVVTVKNFGSNVVTSANVSYSANGGTPVTVAWTGSLAAGASTNITFSGANQFNFVNGNVYNFKFYTDAPNGSTDALNVNDTATATLAPALCGNYTINPSGGVSLPNFVSFTSAANYLTAAGVSCAVNFSVSAATYTEQITLPAITGASATNTITFDGGTGNAASRILTFNSTSGASNFVINMNGGSFFRFKNLTLTPTNTSFGTAVQITNNASNDSFQNLVVNMVTTTLNTSNISGFFNPTSPVTVSNNIVVDRCNINNGSFGIYFYSSSTNSFGLTSQGTSISTNTFTNQYAYGIYAYYMDGIRITDNTITTNSAFTNFRGIETYWMMVLADASKSIVTGNRISGFVGGRGMTFNYWGVNSTVTTVRRPLIANNYVSGISGSNTGFGIADDGWVSGADYVYNSVNILSTSTANTTAAFYLGNQSYQNTPTVQNNIFVGANGAAAVRFENPTGAITSNRNLFFSNGSGAQNFRGYITTTQYTDSTSYRTASTREANTIFNNNPGFVSATNLNHSNGTIKLGANLSTLTTVDIDGRTRATTPYVGAYEVPLPGDLTATVLLSPSLPAVAGTYAVTVRYRNISGSTISASTGSVGYIFNGGTPVTVPNTATLNPLDTSSETFSGANAITINAGSTNTLKVFASGPSDGNTSNDTLTFVICPALSGVYTIDTTQANSATNFKSFNRAVNAITGCGGIAGPVTFLVSSNTYSEQISIGAISGASSTNTVSFVGNGIGNTILTWAGNTTNPHTLRFNGCQYVTFRQMSIRTTDGTNGWTVNFLNSNNNNVRSCQIECTGAAASATGSNVANVVLNGSTTSITATGSSTNNFVDSCNIIGGGQYGICYGPSITSCVNWFRNDSISNAWNYGVYMYSSGAIKLFNNKISTRAGNTGSYGIWLINANATNGSAGTQHQIIGNYVNNVGSSCLTMNTAQGGNGTTMGEIYNNIFGGNFYSSGQVNCMYTTSSNWRYYNNTLVINGNTNVNSNCWWQTITGSNNLVRNNIFAILSTASNNMVPFKIDIASNITSCDNNIYFNNTGSTILNIAGANLNYLTYNLAYPNGGGTGSYYFNPSFVSSTDYHITSSCFNGANLGITTDIDGQTRASLPDIGADENFGSVSNDLGVSTVTGPLNGVPSGSAALRVQVKNYGSASVSSVTVAYTLNGGSPVSETFTLSPALNQCDTQTVVFSTPITIVPGVNTIRAYTSLGGDQNNTNDTLLYGICSALSGSYTINPASPASSTNFQTWFDAITALNCSGVAGPVNFSVANGTYNAAFTLNNIPGTSSTNTVTFASASGTASACTIVGSVANGLTMTLNGAKFINFTNISFTQNNGCCAGRNIDITNASQNINFTGCIFNSAPSNPNSMTNIYESGAGNSNITFSGCTFNQGTYGIQSSPSSRSSKLTITNCTFNNQYNYGIYVNNADSSRIFGNTITTNSATTYYGVYFTSSGNAIRVYNNRVYTGGTSTAYGIFFTSVTGGGAANTRAQIYNNFVSSAAAAVNTFPLYVQSSSNIDVFHNTIYNRSTVTTTNAGAAYFASNGLSVLVKNNIFYTVSTGYSFVQGALGSLAAGDYDYNNYYTAGTNLVNWNGTNYTSLTTWKGGVTNQNNATATSAKSGTQVFTNVATSSNDFHISDNCFSGVATTIATDIDGQTRSISTPTMGADEYSSVTDNLQALAIRNPLSGTGSFTVTVTVKNVGSNAISSGNINYQLNNGSIVTQSIPSTLNPCDTLQLSFTTPVTIPSGYNFLRFFTSDPNGNADGDATNDTIGRTFCTGGIAGNFTIDPAQAASYSNFQSFTTAISTLQGCGGLNGAVNINVAAGTYSGQIDLSSMPGLSSTNTLTFDGGNGNAATRILTASGTGTNYATVRIQNLNYISFRNFTIRGTSSNAWPVHIVASNSGTPVTGVTIKNCNIDFGSTSPSSFNSTNYIGIVISGSTTSYSTNGFFSLVTIDSNNINGGYINISAYNSLSSSYIKNRFTGNTGTNSYQYGMFFQNMNGGFYDRNTLSGLPVSSGGITSNFGMYFTNCYAQTSSDSFSISRNKIFNIGRYGLYLTTSQANGTLRGLMHNNSIGGGFLNSDAYGVYFNGSSYNWDIFHNTINLDAAGTGASSCLYIGNCCSTGSTTLDIRNNNLVVSNPSSSSYCVYMPNGFPYAVIGASNFNYNNMYRSAGTSNYVYAGGTVYTASTFVNGGGYNVNSVSANPYFYGTTDLRVYNAAAFNVPRLTNVLSDINGTSRPVSTDAGAYETPTPNDEIGITALLSPAAPYAAGSYGISATLKNNGANTLTSATVTYSINGTIIDSTNWTGSLASGASTTVNIATTFTYNTGVVYNLKVYSSRPNGNADAWTGNDTFSTTTSPAMCGSYTIDQGSAPSGTNFTSFNTAVTQLVASGVNCPTTFTVMGSTPYTEQVEIASIPGSSATNWVKFDGGSGNAASRTITFNGSSAANAHTIRLNNASNVIIQNLTIRGTGTNAWPMQLTGSTACNRDTVRNCIISFGSTPISSFNSTNYIGVVMSGSTSSYSTTGTFGNCAIDSNTIGGGYGNIMCYNINSSGTSGNSISGNTGNNGYQYGIYVQGSNGGNYDRNIISMNPSGTTGAIGMYFSGVNALSSSITSSISRNKVTYAGQMGIYLTSSAASSSNRGQLVNNVVGGGFTNTTPYGIYFSGSSYSWDVMHNTVNIDNAASGASAACLYLGNCCTTGSTILDVRNNILAVTNSSSTALAFYMPNGYVYAAASTTQFNYNLFFKAGSTSSTLMGYNGGTNITRAAIIGDGGYNANSIYANPYFTSSTNLTISNASNDVPRISSVTSDYNGTSRGTSTDIGAYETPSPNNDLGVTAVVSPSAPVSAGSQNVVVTIKNFGANTVTSANVTYVVNGGSPVTVAWTGTLAAGASTNVTFSGANQFNFVTGNLNNFVIYTSSPNGVADAFTLNDTLTQNISVAMCGNYTINSSIAPSTTNFTSFTSAVNMLSAAGVSCPVIFTVAANTYTEQISIPSITGASSTSTVTFDGGTGNAATRIMSFNPSSSASNYIVQLNGASWVRFKNLTMTNTNSSFGTVVNYFNNASSDSFQSVVMNSPSTTSTSTNNAIVFTPTSPVTVSNDMVFNQCTLNNGAYGFYNYSSTSSSLGASSARFTVSNCTLTNQYYMGIYNQYTDGINILNNTITTNSTYTAYNGLYCYWVMVLSDQNKTIIKNNRISGAVSGYGMYLYYLGVNSGGSNAARRYLVADNYIQIGTANSQTTYGLYAYQDNGVDYIYNSVNIGSNLNTTSAAAAYFQGGYGSYTNTVQNNIFAAYNGAPALRMDANTYYSPSNYNDLYTTGANLGYYANVAYTTLATYRTASSREANSINILPSFVSTSNLNHSNTSLKAGTPLSSLVTDDIDGRPRNATTPYMGGYEVPAANDIAATAILWPSLPTVSGTFDLRFRFRNLSSTTQSSGTGSVGYIWNGGSAVTTTLPVTLNPLDTSNVNFTAALTINPGTTNTLKIFARGTGDGDGTNDTITYSICPALSGTYTIDTTQANSATNFKSFSRAVAALSGCGGVAGPVTFNVSANTYVDQISIGTINGISSTNTVTFNGAGMGSTILTFATTFANPHVVRFSGARFITFRNMSIQSSTTSDGWIVNFLNSSQCKISNCNLNFTNTTAQTSSNSNLANIVVNGNATSMATTTSTSDSIYIDSCVMTYGYYNIVCALNNSSTWPTIWVRNDSMANAYSAAYYDVTTFSYNILKFLNNRVSLRTGVSNQYGIYMRNGTNPPTGKYHQINGNRFNSLNGYGIVFWFGMGNASNAGEIYNNVFGGGTRGATQLIGVNAGVSSPSVNYTNIYHNTFIMDYTSGTSYGINFNSSSSSSTACNIRNNIFYNTSSATSNIAIATPNGAGVITGCDYNNFYTNHSSGVLASTSGSITTSNYKASYPTGLGVNSMNTAISFLSGSDFHHTTSCLLGQTGLGITTDFDGVTRSTPPNVGAYEPSGIPANDASAYILSSPAFPVAAGTQDIKVVVRNNGSNSISSLSASYVLNGASPVTETFTFGSPLNACDTATVTFTVQGTINNGSNTLKVYTSLPSDANNLNDTINTTLCTSLTGTYTIDAAGSGLTNYTTFTAAANALSCGGIGGNVTFNVAAGTYNEQVLLNSIPGSNSSRKVIFQSASGNPADVVLTAAGTGSANYVFGFNAVSNIAVRNMTITNTSNTFGNVISLFNGSSNDTFTNLTLNAQVSVTNNTNISIVNIPNNGVNNYLYFDTCRFNNGSYGVYIISNSNHGSNGNASQLIGVNNSTLTNQGYSGIYATQVDGIRFTSNRITTNASVSNYVGIYANWITSTIDNNRSFITGNSIVHTTGQYGIQLNQINTVYGGANSRRLLVANNMVSVGAGASNVYAFWEQYINYADIYHNTFVNGSSSVGTASSAAAFLTVAYTSTTNNIVNNIFHSSNGGVPVQMNNNSFYNVINYNDIYTSHPTIFGYYNGSAQGSIGAWRTAIGNKDMNSFSIRPIYVSASDLHIANKGCMDNLGTASSSVVSIDIDKATRNVSTPDVGADEFSSLAYDARLTTLLSPTSTSITPGNPYTVQVRIYNQGSTAISSILMNYDLNGTVTSQTFTPGSAIAPCDSATFTFSSSVVFPSGTSTLKIYSSTINGSNADLDNTNDTITNTYCAPYTGTLYVIPTVTPNNTDTFATLSSLITRVYNCGIGGPVTVEVADGQYNENMTFNGMISGSSPINTLTIRPAAGDTGVWVNGTGTANVIDLNGAKYITFDGRAGGTGTSRIFNVVSTNTGFSSVRMINDAIRDTFRFVNVYGNNASSGVGNFYIGTSTGTIGNDSNTIEYSYFSNSTTLPVQQIAATGTAGRENDYITIRNNVILNYFQPLNANNAGIFTNGNNRNWNISNNSISQTAIRAHVLTGTTAMHGIYAFSNTDINFNITGNTIGGNIPGIAGSVFQLGDSTLPSGQINQMFLVRYTGTVTLAAGTTYITGNTLRTAKVFTNITAGMQSTMAAVLVNAANVEIGGDGVSAGNIIGDINNIRDMEVVNMSTGGGARLALIRIINGAQNIKIKNNQIGGAAVRTPNNVAVTTNEIVGIQQFMTAANTTCYIDSNTIQNLENVSGSLGSGTVAGIWASANGSTHNHFIRSNTINNLVNNSTSSNTFNNTWGIMTNYGQNGSGTASAASFKIDSNVVSNISSASTLTSTLNGAAVIGIGMGTVSAQASPEIINNRIFNISASGSNTSVYGMYYANTGSNGQVTRNRIYNLTNSATSGASTNISGITVGAVNNTTFANNQISIVQTGSSIATIGGISDATSTNTVNYHYNSVYLGGNQTGSSTNAGVFTRTSAGSTLNLRNNIFYNDHLSSGNNFLITIPSAWGGTTSQYNYFVSADTLNAFRNQGTSTTYAFTGWKAAISDATGSTANTTTMVPASTFFADAANGDLNVVSNFCEIQDKAVVVSTTNDFANTTRSATPDIGSMELGTLYDLGVSSIATPVDGSGMTNSMTVSVYVTNFSGSAITSTVNMPVRYSVNNGPAVSELLTITPTLNAGDSVLYTFTTTANMSTTGTYNFKAWTSGCDASNSNDTAYKAVIHQDSIRMVPGDFITGTCPNLSGNSWIDLKDSANNLVMSINPNGNNLGNTCFGVRIYNGAGLRVDTAMTGDIGFFLDRNFYVEPTTQPTSPVSVRIYVDSASVQEVVDSTFNRFGMNITADSIRINKYHGPRVDLDPYNNDTAVSEYEVILPTYNVWNNSNRFRYYEFNVNSFSELNPGLVPNSPLTPLPVSWLSFTAEKNGNNALLKWSTATEFNSNRFEIERSIDGVNFTSIGKVNAAGMSPTSKSYQYTDVNASQVAPVVFYRITEYDNAEKSTSTDVKYVTFGGVTAGSISAWPNPATDVLNISVPVEQDENASVSVIDMTGKTVDIKNVKLSKGMNVRTISMDGLAKGIYMIQVNINGKVENLRIVKH